MKRIGFLLYFVAVCLCIGHAHTAKYVFYLIGDGMGMSQVLAAEMYQAELEGRIGTCPLLFSQFPYATMATTFSATNGVTDSAASGTALATGHKTKNGTIGMLPDLQTTVNSIALWAKHSGKRVGVATSVSVDHATPAAFYSHQPNRKNYYDIGLDLYAAGYDFYAGSDFLQPNQTNCMNLYDMAATKGYTLARGYDEYLKKRNKANRMILLQTESASRKDRTAIPYAIDRQSDDLTLPQITDAAIDFLSKDNDKGFFLMLEGGKIDWACHANDAATMLQEVLDFENAVKKVYDFYLEHPNETLIVVTADHSTGGMALGTGEYALNLKVLKNQKKSELEFSNVLHQMRKESKGIVPWETIQQILSEYFGFWKEVPLNDVEEQKLKSIYLQTFANNDADMEKSEYSESELLAAEAKRILNNKALIGWTSGGHSAGLVPVCAIGVGAESFSMRTDNAELPLKIAAIASYEIAH